MSWTNERIIELIENYESEPIVWNPRDPNYKKHHLNHEAWGRIKANLSWQVTAEECKSKMKSLMAYYRVHAKKCKNSLNSGTGNVYQTNWFAFSALNSFLGPVYESQPSDIRIKEEESQRPITTHMIEDDDTEITFVIEEREIEERPDSSVNKKTRKDNLPTEIINARQTIQETFQNIETDEYEIFGKLIASKIRKLNNTNTREIVMNDIHNLIFRAGVTDRREQSTPSYRSTSQSPNKQT